ncbi:ferritin-like domain-containing protein [Haloarchaeobius amylolyticus]|uniref:ferritin-like domain-containing protein n=1 Tax=Haloarchaeobius amylolyticus TaxID=1198296 RepID=UPI0022703368|nr:ferritin-like domain-containing protein [Haloarchaeobius amylolyticus]
MSQHHGRLVREPPTGTVRQRWGTLAPNEVGLHDAVAEELVDALVVDHANSFNLFSVLRKHYWTAAGAERGPVATFLEAAYRRVRDVNDDLAVRIVQLGGIPPNTPPTIQARATVHLEGEDLYDLRASLQGDVAAYATLVETMREHTTLAERLGDQATAELLSDRLERLEADTDHLETLLEDDALVPPRAEQGGDTGTAENSEEESASTPATSHLRRPGPSHKFEAEAHEFSRGRKPTVVHRTTAGGEAAIPTGSVSIERYDSRSD